MVMMLPSVELYQSCIIGSINFFHVVLTLSTTLKFLRVLLLSMNDGGVMLPLVLSGDLDSGGDWPYMYFKVTLLEAVVRGMSM